MFLHKPKFWICKVFNGTRRILYLNFANMGACVICLYICFVKKTADLKKNSNPFTLKVYYGLVLSQHYIIMN